jgi:Uma2 family endonuclease
MTVAPWPDHLLTIEEWDELPEDTYRHAELVDGVLVVTPTPMPAHQVASKRLVREIDDSLVGGGWTCVPDIDVVLVDSFPPLVRQPDLVVVSAELLRVRPKRFTAADVAVAVEIVSPGSKRTDRIAKVVDYAEAGIPHYWIVDIDEPISLEAFTLVGDGYEKVAEFTAPELAQLADPAPVTIDLAKLAI